jgi:2-polyprenyl-3-methyl-5-hydroxy-6-metoxy-1,4-benzoquinol methylase
MLEASDERARLESYQARLYASYVSTHNGAIHNPSRETLSLGFPYLRKHFLPHLPQERNAAILEIGCGYGLLLHYLQTLGYTNVMGVDISPEQVALATKLEIKNVERADMLTVLSKHREDVDVIIAADVLEHIRKVDLLPLLDRVATALKPKGRIIVQTANAEGPFAGAYRYGDLTHELAFTSRSISQALRLVGFSRVRVFSVEPAVHGLKSAVRLALWRCIELALTWSVAIETGVAHGHIVSQNLIAVGDK